MKKTFQYYAVYKPYGMLSQFSEEMGHTTLASLSDFQKDVYPVGRLDADSEGLLLLTNDTSINKYLLNPRYQHQRTYLVQVEGQFTPEAKIALEQGVTITVDGKPHETLPSKIEILPIAPEVTERIPPIRFRKTVPDSWISITLCEGKNRQVRKMTAKAGYPTLRLIRINIENLTLGAMKPGDIIEMEKKEIYELLKIKVKK